MFFDYSNVLFAFLDQWCESSSGDASETWMLATLPQACPFCSILMSSCHRCQNCEGQDCQTPRGMQALNTGRYKSTMYTKLTLYLHSSVLFQSTLMLVKMSRSVVFIPVMKCLTLCWPISVLSWHKSLLPMQMHRSMCMLVASILMVARSKWKSRPPASPQLSKNRFGILGHVSYPFLSYLIHLNILVNMSKVLILVQSPGQTWQILDTIS